MSVLGLHGLITDMRRHTEFIIRKIRANSRLSDVDAAALAALPLHVTKIPVDTPIVSEGDQPSRSCLLLEGFAYRSKVADSGKRQILSFHIAGDIPDLQSIFLKRMDHDLTAISPATLGFIEHSALFSLFGDHPAIAHALWRETLIDAAIFREWIVNVGVRRAAGRMTHLLAEMHERMIAVGLAVDGTFEFPITQGELGDALGLSTVHVNRVLQSLRSNGVLDFHGNKVTIEDHKKLVAMAGFDKNYLYLAGDIN